MLLSVLCLSVLIFVVPANAVEYGTMTPPKEDALQFIDDHADLMREVSTYIWHHPELGLGEHYSSAVLIDMLQRAGFTVETGVAGMDTAFIATWGSGKPYIGFHLEYDALPELSQVAGSTTREMIVPGAPGHGCGHNYFGTASAIAGMAVKHAMERHNIPGTLRLYGTPAEETLVGKAFFAKYGIYDNDDVVISWHPGQVSGVNYNSSLAMDNFKVRYRGISAHAASNPWDGRSALDAVELFNISMNFMREHVRPETRIHYVITNGGSAPNVVPPFAEVWYFVRAPQYHMVQDLVDRARRAAEGAALMTDTEMEFIKITGVWQYLPNRAFARIGHANVELIGGTPHCEEHQRIAEEFARTWGITEYPFINTGITNWVDEPFTWATGGGSIDEANTSWIVPMIRFSAANVARGTPGHSWQRVAQDVLEPAYLGSQVVAKYMAATALDILMNPALLEEIWDDHRDSLERFGPYFCPVADVPVPSFELMHGVTEASVPRQWEVAPYPYPDFDTLLRIY